LRQIGIPKPIQIVTPQIAFDFDRRRFLDRQQHITRLHEVTWFNRIVSDDTVERRDDSGSIQSQLSLLLTNSCQGRLSLQSCAANGDQISHILQQAQRTAGFQFKPLSLVETRLGNCVFRE
jgi:hypothetical protein